MTMCFQDDSLAIGAGDNNVHILDLEHGAFKVHLLLLPLLQLMSGHVTDL